MLIEVIERRNLNYGLGEINSRLTDVTTPIALEAASAAQQARKRLLTPRSEGWHRDLIRGER
jgi:hypothetical protein